MKMISVLLFALFLVFGSVGCGENKITSANTSSAASSAPAVTATPAPTPANDVWVIMQFLNDPNNSAKFAPYNKEKNGAVTATFYREGVRNTMYVSGKYDNGIWPTKNTTLSYWVGGKSTPRETFSCNFTGKVHFGSITDKSVQDDKYFQDDTLTGGTVKSGEGNRDYWQGELNDAIYATLHQIGRDDLIPTQLF